MSNPSGPDEEPHDDGAETELIAAADSGDAAKAPEATSERRFTAPSGFDAGKTQVLNTVPEPETEVFAPLETSASAPTQPFAASGSAAPQLIPGRAKATGERRRSWGWVIAVVLVFLAIVAVAIFGTVWLTRNSAAPADSQHGGVRGTIQNVDVANQIDA